jgi:pectate lyase
LTGARRHRFGAVRLGVLASLGAMLALGALGCGRDVAQTAYREPTAADEFSCDEPVATAPTPPTWLTGGIEASPLVGEYGPGEGPGLWLTARDAYRVYLNGVAVQQSARARSADFVPLTLLPGDNQLVVAVWAASGTPAALLQLDELSQSYVSGDDWRVETSPGSRFASLDYDAGGAVSASNLGRLGALPGCDPASGFPLDSLAGWIGPPAGSGNSAVLRKTIRIAPIGFGQAATGGGNTTPILVDTWEDFEALATDPETAATILLREGVHDFRRKGDDVNQRAVCPSTCSDDPTKMLYTVLTSSETCPVAQVMKPLEERRLSLASNKTIVGLGRGAQIRGVSFNLGPIQNVVLRNLAIFDVNRGLIEAGDALGLDRCSDVWLDHLTTKWISDGLTDISPGTKNVTLSWMHYDGLMDEACRGRHTHASTINDSSITLHHSFFDHTDSHAPLVSEAEARVHIFNGLIQDDAGYGVAASCGAQVLLEGTTFRAVMTPTARRDCDDMPPFGRISTPQGSNLANLYFDSGKHGGGDGGDGTEPHDEVFDPPYDYQPEPTSEAWPRVQQRAGAGGPWKQQLSVDEP